LLIFSPLETADFLMLFTPSGDGYSLLCSKKQPPQHKAFKGDFLSGVIFGYKVASLDLYIPFEAVDNRKSYRFTWG
jgi:hypothetical protein